MSALFLSAKRSITYSTVKAAIIGSDYSLFKPVFCPVNGEYLKPHFVDPNIATATESQQESLAEGSSGYIIEYTVDFEGSDEQELVLQSNASNHLEPGFYTFMMEGNGVKVDPNRNEIKVIVDLDERVVVMPVANCPGNPAPLKSPTGECYHWDDLDPSQRNNQEVIIDKHLFGKTYTVHRLINFKVYSATFTDNDIIKLPYRLDGPKQTCKKNTVQVNLSLVQPELTGWSHQWKNDSSITGLTFNILEIQETQTITVILTDPNGCTYELSHTVEVLDLGNNLKLTPPNSVVCRGTRIQLKVEGTTPVTSGYYVYKWFFTGKNPRNDNAFLDRVPTTGNGEKTSVILNWFGEFRVDVSFVSSTGDQQCLVAQLRTEIKEKTNYTSLCDIKKHFESAGYFAIPVELSRSNGVTKPKQRSASNLCDCPDDGICAIDETGLSVKIKSDMISRMGDHEIGLLNTFSAEFGYNTGQALITKNDDLCSCENALKDLEEAFSSSALGFRIHLFEHQKTGQTACGDTDYLFIKAKGPSGRVFPADGREEQYLDLAYAHLTNDLGLSGSKAYDELCALMLDNRMSPADPEIFSDATEASVGVETNPCSSYALSAPICMAPSGVPMRLPDKSVLRFQYEPTYTGLKPPGALAGFTELLPDRKLKFYEAFIANPTDEPNNYIFYGYQQLGGSIWMSKSRGSTPYRIELGSEPASGGGILVKSYLYTPKAGTLLSSEGKGKVLPDVMVSKDEWKYANETRKLGGSEDLPGPPQGIKIDDISNELANFYYYKGESFDGYGFYVDTDLPSKPGVKESYYVFIWVNRVSPYNSKIYVFNPLDCFYYEIEGVDAINFDFYSAYRWAITIKAVTSKEFVQGLLEVGGLVLPIFDAVNTLIYLADGNISAAAWSFVSMLPVADWVVRAGKIVANNVIVTGAALMIKQITYKGNKYLANVAKNLDEWQNIHNLTADEALKLFNFSNTSDDILYLLTKNPGLSKVWKEGVNNGLDDNALKLLFKDMESNGNFLIEMAGRPQLVKTWKLVKEMGSDLRANFDVITRLTDDLGKEGLEAFLKTRGKSGLAAWNILDGAKKCFN